MNSVASQSKKGLSLAGQAFFGSLCVGTFGLGCWQAQRYFQKVEMVAERKTQLEMEPRIGFPSLIEGDIGFTRVELHGRFLHDKEVLVGPRAAPPGALPEKPGSSSSGMSSGPQGYFVLTPFQSNGRTVVVNRGWVPRHFGVTSSNLRRGNRPSSMIESASPHFLQWYRPEGSSTITVVRAQPEEPKFLVAEHMLEQHPPTLFWFDEETLKHLSLSSSESGQVTDDALILATQVRPEGDDDLGLEWPLSPPASRVGDFKTTPAVHLGYLVTWYGLSAAGVYMTRLLMRRGR